MFFTRFLRKVDWIQNHAPVFPTQTLIAARGLLVKQQDVSTSQSAGRLRVHAEADSSTRAALQLKRSRTRVPPRDDVCRRRGTKYRRRRGGAMLDWTGYDAPCHHYASSIFTSSCQSSAWLMSWNTEAMPDSSNGSVGLRGLAKYSCWYLFYSQLLVHFW